MADMQSKKHMLEFFLHVGVKCYSQNRICRAIMPAQTSFIERLLLSLVDPSQNYIREP